MDRTTTQDQEPVERAEAVAFLVRMAKRSHADMRRFKASAIARDAEAQRFAYLNAARYFYASSRARVQNIRRRAE